MARRAADLETLEQVRRIQADCAAKGHDLAERLDKAGLLLHPARRREVQANALFELADTLEAMTVGQLARDGERVPQTPLDTRRLVVSWMREMASKVSQS